MSTETVKTCRCGKNPAAPMHDCPYRYEMASGDDPGDEDYCDCCEACTHDCAMDI